VQRILVPGFTLGPNLQRRAVGYPGRVFTHPSMGAVRQIANREQIPRGNPQNFADRPRLPWGRDRGTEEKVARDCVHRLLVSVFTSRRILVLPR
jgi:hypothetical protein